MSQNNPTPVLPCSKRQSKGAISLSRSRPPLPIFEDMVRCPDHNYTSLQSYSGRASRARRYPYSVITFRCKSFLVPSAAASFLGARVSFVSGSLAGPLSEALADLVSDALAEFRCRFSSGLRSRYSSGVPSSALAGYASGSPGVPFPVFLRTPLPVLRRLLSTLFFWRISPPLN